jgi:broad specificity phosphatase PhoE
MSNIRVFVARHGQIASGEFIRNDPNLPKSDPPLSPLGITQAQLLAEELKRLNFNGRIYSSPFRRTLMTAQATAKLLGAPLYPCSALREVIKVKDSLKDFSGLTLEGIKELFPETANDATLVYPWWENEPETSDDMDKRVSPIVDLATEAQEDILLIGHGASVVATFRCLMKKTNLRFEDSLPKWYNCALTQFKIENGTVIPVTVNSVSHLPATMLTENYRYALVDEKNN